MADPICRGVEVPGIYFVRLVRAGGPTVISFRDNRYFGFVKEGSSEEIDLELVSSERGDRFTLSDRHSGALPPPWSTVDTGRYSAAPQIEVAPFVTLSIATHSPLGDVAVTTRYEFGRPVERLLQPLETLDWKGSPPDLVIRRRLSSVLLQAAGMIDVLSSFEGGSVQGDWSKLMLLAGITDGPEMREANALGRLSRPELASLALFSELWAQGTVPGMARNE